MLSLLGWFTGIISTVHFIIYLIMGFSFLIQAIRSKIKLLLYAGLTAILASFLSFAQIIDFFTVLLTSNNNPNSLFLVIVHGWWVICGILVFFLIYLELNFPKKKLPMICVFAWCFSCGIYLLVNPSGVFFIAYPINSGEYLIQVKWSLNNPLTLLFLGAAVIMQIVSNISFFSKKLEGVIRRKFLFLNIATTTLLLIIELEFSFDIGNGIIITRIVLLLSTFFWYYGLREEPVKKEKPQKEVDVKASLLRIAKRPEHITEEEVTFHKEQKICLVCKGSVSRVSYICPECSALYCVKCSEVLSSQENACWICDEPFDESRPSQPFAEEKEDIEVEISDEAEEGVKIVK